MGGVPAVVVAVACLACLAWSCCLVLHPTPPPIHLPTMFVAISHPEAVHRCRPFCRQTLRLCALHHPAGTPSSVSATSACAPTKTHQLDTPLKGVIIQGSEHGTPFSQHRLWLVSLALLSNITRPSCNCQKQASGVQITSHDQTCFVSLILRILLHDID